MKILEGKIMKHKMPNISIINDVSYVLTDITNGEFLDYASNKIRIGLLELGKMTEKISRYNRSFYVGKVHEKITQYEFERDFFPPFSGEHMAQIYIGKKEDIDKIYEETKSLYYKNEAQAELAKHIESVSEANMSYYQEDLGNEISIFHIAYDSDVYDYIEKKLIEKNLLDNLLFVLSPDDLFSSYYSYWDDWFCENTSEEICIAHYESYKDQPEIQKEIIEIANQDKEIYGIILNKYLLEKKLEIKNNKSTITKL